MMPWRRPAINLNYVEICIMDPEELYLVVLDNIRSDAFTVTYIGGMCECIFLGCFWGCVCLYSEVVWVRVFASNRQFDTCVSIFGTMKIWHASCKTPSTIKFRSAIEGLSY